jgi:hypothetical protein
MAPFGTSLSHKLNYGVARQLRNWPGLLVIGLVGGAAAVWIGWPWLVALGLAPFIVAALPCLLMCGAMCAANLCMRPKQREHSEFISTEDTAASKSRSSVSSPHRPLDKL